MSYPTAAVLLFLMVHLAAASTVYNLSPDNTFEHKGSINLNIDINTAKKDICVNININNQTTPDPTPDRLDQVELVSLDPLNNTVPTCLRSLNKCPISISNHMIGTVGSVPLICGGYQGGSSSSKCYKYHFNNDTWVQSISLPKAVTYMGFDSNDEWGLVYVGGYNRSGSRQAESYSTKDGTDFKQLTSIPVATHSPCLVIVDNKTLFMAGGSTNRHTKKSYVYSRSSTYWTEVADMRTGRFGHSCALVKKQTTEGNEIVAVGGREGGVYLNTVEIFSMKTLSWRTAATLLSERMQPAIVNYNYNNAFLILGGRNSSSNLDTILLYNHTEEHFEVLPQKLAMPNRFLAAMAVDSSLFPACA
jgi:hypothetical protein